MVARGRHIREDRIRALLVPAGIRRGGRRLPRARLLAGDRKGVLTRVCPRQLLTRRAFLRSLLNGGVLALLGATLYPIARYLFPPRGSEASVSSVVAANIGELATNTAKTFRFGTRPGLLIHTSQGRLKAFSAVCTHLNCTVQYDQHDEVIWCACHNGKFDLNGQVISGPPPRPLESYQVNLRGEEIVVSKSA
ncbi:MAG TPA: plastoquinol--plastocyanin reductase [Candidatus Omnitrophica bacterium]|nr:plastoquinol--plastocyanin reductase [Candidatus Omnitrophota bacterium]